MIDDDDHPNKRDCRISLGRSSGEVNYGPFILTPYILNADKHKLEGAIKFPRLEITFAFLSPHQHHQAQLIRENESDGEGYRRVH